MNTRTHEAIRLTAPLQLRAASDGKKLPSQFSGVAYTGGLVPSFGVVIDLASTTVPPVMPLLSEHVRTDMIGLVSSTRKQNDQLIVTGALYSDMAGTQAEKIAQLSQRGFPFQMSVGLFNFSEESVQAGQRVNVNGRDFVGPVTVLRNGAVRECSIVTLGADPDTEARFFNNPHAREHAITALFSELGELPTSTERAAYLAMSPTAFAMFAATLRSVATKARGMRAELERLNAADIYRNRREPSRGEAKPLTASLSAGDIYARRRARPAGSGLS